ncbi:hypothetical protein CLOP_g22389, partial [Closterium sp. NIES-67]
AAGGGGRAEGELAGDLVELVARWREVLARAHAAAGHVRSVAEVRAVGPTLLMQGTPMALDAIHSLLLHHAKVSQLVVDSPAFLQELECHLQRMQPALCGRVQLHSSPAPIFDALNVEPALHSALHRCVPLPGGGSLVIEETEALVAIDVNSGVECAAAHRAAGRHVPGCQRGGCQT